MTTDSLLAGLPLILPEPPRPQGPYMESIPGPRAMPKQPAYQSAFFGPVHQFAVEQLVKLLADRKTVPSWQMPYPMPATQGERDVLGVLPVAGDVEDMRYLMEGMHEGDPAKMLMGGAATALPFVPASLLHTVYHGSPHIFDAFKMSKIGTGEGAQVYGHGLYFAENPEVAHAYRTQLTAKIDVDGRIILENNRQVGTTGNEDVDEYLISHDGDIDAAIDELEHVVTGRIDALGRPVANPDPVTVERYQREYLPALDMLRDIKRRGAIDTSTGGSFYEVEIPDEAVGRMLDWDKPLSEQPWLAEGTKEEIIAKVRAEGRKPTVAEIARVSLESPSYGDPSGRVFYKDLAQKLGSESAASEALRQAGIPGIRYLDQMSRGAEEGTRNLVLFDESLARILERK